MCKCICAVPPYQKAPLSGRENGAGIWACYRASIAAFRRRRVSSLPIMAARSVPPPGVRALPDRAMPSGNTPEVWDAARASGPADLTLSGHVHAMQFKIRIGNWAWSPARWMYTRWSGLYEEEGKKLFINDGLGYVMYPMRIGTYPSITIFTLRSAVRP